MTCSQESQIPDARNRQKFERAAVRAQQTGRVVVAKIGRNLIRFWVDGDGVLRTALL